MHNPASPADIEARWRPLSSAENTVAQTHLDDAWLELQQNVPTMVARLEVEPAVLDVNIVKRVLAQMVKRVLKNPDGYQSEQIDDYKFVRAKEDATGELYITERELALLTPGSSTGAFSIRPSYVPDDSASLAAYYASRGLL